jgi:hypothetical protein
MRSLSGLRILAQQFEWFQADDLSAAPEVCKGVKSRLLGISAFGSRADVGSLTSTECQRVNPSFEEAAIDDPKSSPQQLERRLELARRIADQTIDPATKAGLDQAIRDLEQQLADSMRNDLKAKLLAVLDEAEGYRVLAIRSRDRGERESYERIVEL